MGGGGGPGGERAEDRAPGGERATREGGAMRGAGEAGGSPEAQNKHRPPVFLADRADLERGSIVLSGAEGRHAATVRRLSAGERADVTDGAGTVAECVVTGARPGVVELAVLATRAEPAPEPRIVVVQAIPKSDRGELAVEIMTEVGVDAVVAWQAERCVARWRGDRAGKALARWQSTAREAAKQARRGWRSSSTPRRPPRWGASACPAGARSS